jgi:hypothetical protein
MNTLIGAVLFVATGIFILIAVLGDRTVSNFSGIVAFIFGCVGLRFFVVGLVDSYKDRTLNRSLHKLREQK